MTIAKESTFYYGRFTFTSDPASSLELKILTKKIERRQIASTEKFYRELGPTSKRRRSNQLENSSTPVVLPKC